MNKLGFVATSTVLVVSVVAIAIALSVSVLSIGSSQGSLAVSQGNQTLAFVEGCTEDALLAAKNSATFGDPVGNITTLLRPEGNCIITINSRVGEVWTMTVTAATPSATTPIPTSVPGATSTPTSAATPVPTNTPTVNEWPMAGANPQRTNWVPENINATIATQWVKPISPYVPQKVQVIAADNKVFVSTAAGLYAFDAATGADLWQYPTLLPLVNSPTYSNGFLYVGGLDHKIHKINAGTGQGVWTFDADAGFSSSVIVSDNRIYATNRDGALYAVNDVTPPTLAWKFQTGSQLVQSPAYKDGILYFASNDGFAYAVTASNGNQVWKSDADGNTPTKDKFPSYGFHAWWPVIYGNDVIFVSNSFYASNGPEAYWIYCQPPNNLPATCPSITANASPGALGNQPGNWVSGEKTLDIRSNPYGSTIIDYYETYPYRRNFYFVNRTTGIERTFDMDSDSVVDYAPITFVGDGGSHDPPVVVGNATSSDLDDVLYFHTSNRSRSLSFNNANISGWAVGTPYLSLPVSYIRSSDEPTGLTAAGSKIYYNHCCDRAIGAVDISTPNTGFPTVDGNREKTYVSGGGLSYFSWPLDVTGLTKTQTDYYYNEAVKFFWDPQPSLSPPCCPGVFWNENDKTGPSVYNGRIYTILGNALVAIGPGGAGSTAPRLASAPNVTPTPTVLPSITDAVIKSRIETEVQKIVNAGHLQPGYFFGGLNSTSSNYRTIDDYLVHYWHNPADVHQILLRALPYLSASLQTQVRTYLQSEYTNFPPYTYAHIGFIEGVQRDPYPYPPAENVFRIFTPPTTGKQFGSNFGTTWNFPPDNVYAMWKYAQAGLGTPATVFANWGTTRLRAPITVNNSALTDQYLTDHPLVSNAYINAYKGFVELAKLAGQSSAVWQAHQDELDRLLALRVNNMTTFPDSANSAACSYRCYYRTMITYYNFAHMTPELADYLAINARSADPNKDILVILQKYQDIAPYWMMAHNGETQGESALMPYQQTHSLFQGLAQIKKASRQELLKYLDTPIIPTGDMYYIDNLVSLLQAADAPGSPTVTPTLVPGQPTPTASPVPGQSSAVPSYQKFIQVVFNRSAAGITIISWREI
jgi:outer membrane protein assembly factor BamB